MRNSEHVTTRMALISFLASFVVLAIKFYAYTETHSTAVLSDALETIVNVVASFAALLVMRAVAEPADAEHPYGHGKLEYFSSAFEGGMIAFAAIVISYEAGVAISLGKALHRLDAGMVYVAIASAINFVLAMFLIRVSRKHHSEALRASGWHLISDVLTSLGVLVGLFLVKMTGYQWLDPLIALVMALFLAWSGVKIVRKAVGALIDEIEPTSVLQLAQAIQLNRTPGVIDIHHMKVIRSGRFHHVDLHMVVPEFWDIQKSHHLAQEFEKKVMQTYVCDGEMAFHLDPCQRRFCSFCDLGECAVRKRPFQKLKTFSDQTLVQGPVYDE